jgi:hypothetical protein
MRNAPMVEAPTQCIVVHFLLGEKGRCEIIIHDRLCLGIGLGGSRAHQVRVGTSRGNIQCTFRTSIDLLMHV